MQEEWDKWCDAAELAAGTTERKLPLVGSLVRLLLVGSGGRSNTLIFRKVLIPLCETFYGTNGVIKEASSNTAASLLRGKTVHATNKLQGGASLRTVHLRLNEERGRAIGKMYGSMGANIIGEFSQLSVKLLHADA